MHLGEFDSSLQKYNNIPSPPSTKKLTPVQRPKRTCTGVNLLQLVCSNNA